LDNTSKKETLIQPWCYKTLAVIKRLKISYLFCYLGSVAWWWCWTMLQ